MVMFLNSKLHGRTVKQLGVAYLRSEVEVTGYILKQFANGLFATGRVNNPGVASFRISHLYTEVQSEDGADSVYAYFYKVELAITMEWADGALTDEIFENLITKINKEIGDIWI